MTMTCNGACLAPGISQVTKLATAFDSRVVQFAFSLGPS